MKICFYGSALCLGLGLEQFLESESQVRSLILPFLRHRLKNHVLVKGITLQ